MWIFREKDGDLYVSTHKPERKNDRWSVFALYYNDYNNQFSDIKWEDEPIEVELVRK